MKVMHKIIDDWQADRLSRELDYYFANGWEVLQLWTARIGNHDPHDTRHYALLRIALVSDAPE